MLRAIKILIVTALALVLLGAVTGGAGIYFTKNWLETNQPQMFQPPIFDTEQPTTDSLPPENPGQLRVLVFSKTNGFRHHEAIAAAGDMFQAIARERNWIVYETENGAIFDTAFERHFDVLVWSNATGDLLTPSQRSGVETFLHSGGGFVGLHAAGDASHAPWRWYTEEVIRAEFTGHILMPRYQTATLTMEGDHPAIAHLPVNWQHEDEWYCFDASPRPRTKVLATIDENELNLWAIDRRGGARIGSLAMGDDHPVIWHHEIGNGRIFYSSLGHTPETFQNNGIKQMLATAVEWSAANRKNEQP